MILHRFIVKINPNYVSILGLVVAGIAGYLFYIDWILVAGLFVLLNGFLDMLDGEIAKKYKTSSKLGDFIDHTFDRLSDVLILSGIAMNYTVPVLIGFSLVIITLLVSYLGTQAHALTGKRLYAGIVGRSDRLILIFIFSFMTMFYSLSLYYGVIILLTLSLITFIERFYDIYNELK